MPAWLGTPHDMVFSLSMRGEQTWAVGSFGILVKRTPQSPWKLVSDTGGSAMLGIAFAPSGDGVAVGQAGNLYEVAAGFDTWTRHDVGTTERLFAVASSAKGEFVAVGSFGTILDRPAGSKEWRQVSTTWNGGTTPHLYSVLFADDTTALVVGEDETVVTVKGGVATDISDLGQSSKPKVPAATTPMQEAAAAAGISGAGPVEPAFFTIAKCGGAIYASGQQGLLAIKQGGANWQIETIPGKPDFFGLTCTPDGQLIGTSAGFLVVGKRQNNEWVWQQRPVVPVRLDWIASAMPVGPDVLLLAGPAAVWEGQLDGSR
jgi:photosystem II stability/assembly factor-like uncharacterized protein